jgi:hypothetical protein
VADARIANLRDCTTVDEHTGAMRSVQTADVLLSEHTLSELWSPENLERLARTYWRFLTRVTLGIVRVRYTERERLVVLLGRPLTLLAFNAPEYELEPDHGVVRWRIVRGLLVARAGRASKGHLQIDVRRVPVEGPGEASLEGASSAGASLEGASSAGASLEGASSAGASLVEESLVEESLVEESLERESLERESLGAAGSKGATAEVESTKVAHLHVEVEVANFHPAIASGLSLHLYNATQARIHVLVTHGFLRSLARLNLAESRVGHLARTEGAAADSGAIVPR